MAKVVEVEAAKPKKGPKVLSHIEVHPRLGGGHVVRHVYNGYQHDPREYSFGKDEGGRAAAHVLKHTGLPHPGADDGEEMEGDAAGNEAY